MQSLDIQLSESDPDIAVVIGGDGTFSYFGRKLGLPMLLVGVPNNDILGSKSRLAEISLKNLSKTLTTISKGKYLVEKKRMLDLRYGSLPAVSILTDVYLERGIFSGCIRYSISISKKNTKLKDSQLHKPLFTDFVIGNGVIISTSFGSSGYYSYLDRLHDHTRKSIELFDDNKLGICHILPTFAVRRMGNKGKFKDLSSPRYTVSSSSTIDITITRKANIRLYGTTFHSRGIRVNWKNPIQVTSSSKIAKIIRLL